jgi:hypothetical protein
VGGSFGVGKPILEFKLHSTLFYLAARLASFAKQGVLAGRGFERDEFNIALSLLSSLK